MSFRIKLSDNVLLDASKLVDTRMLIAGSSGSGKSYAMRVVAEQAAPKIQTFVLDPEGEYTTLREKIDLVIVGKDGEVVPTVATAAKLARKLLELQVSAVIDLYDLKVPERRAFVRRFIDSMMTVPKNLWRPCIVMLDESHKFCPERSAGQSESTDSVITLLSQGRKRGFCGILSTQRLQKLHKDAAAETLNNLIGRTSLDVDVHRAREILGFPKADEKILRHLDPGSWYGFGPAMYDGKGNAIGVVGFRAAKATTTHPEPGKRHAIQAPAPSARIRKVLPELAELPQAVEQEEQTIESLQKRIRELERSARKGDGAPKSSLPPPQPGPSARTVKLMEQAHSKLLARVVKDLGKIRSELDKVSTGLRSVDQAVVDVATAAAAAPPTIVESVEAPRHNARVAPATARRSKPAKGNGGGGMRRILVALASSGGCSRHDLAIISMMSPGSGTFGTYLGRHRTDRLIEEVDGIYQLTDAGERELGEYTPIPTGGEDLYEAWAAEIGGGGIGRIFEVLYEAGPDGLDRDDLHTRAKLSNSGTFGTYVGKLRKKRGLLTDNGWPIALQPIFFQ